LKTLGLLKAWRSGKAGGNAPPPGGDADLS
jgi:hypothetical protein